MITMRQCFIAVSSDIEKPEDMKQKVDELDELMDNKFYHPEIKVFYRIWRAIRQE